MPKLITHPFMVHEHDSLSPLESVIRNKSQLIILTGNEKVGKTVFTLKLLHTLLEDKSLNSKPILLSYDNGLQYQKKMVKDEHLFSHTMQFPVRIELNLSDSLMTLKLLRELQYPELRSKNRHLENDPFKYDVESKLSLNDIMNGIKWLRDKEGYNFFLMDGLDLLFERSRFYGRIMFNFVLNSIDEHPASFLITLRTDKQQEVKELLSGLTRPDKYKFWSLSRPLQSGDELRESGETILYYE